MSLNGGYQNTRSSAPPMPDKVEVWNVEARCSVAVHSSNSIHQVRFSLERELWESIGRPPRVSIAGDPKGGFKITWGGAYAVQHRATGAVFIYSKPGSLGLPNQTRGAHVLKARSREGTIVIEPPHPLWLANDPAFHFEGLTRTGRPAAKPAMTKVEPAAPVPPPPEPTPRGVTSPAPKARPDLPVVTRVDELKARLRDLLASVVVTKAELERATGLKFKLTSKGGFMVDM